MNLLPSNENTLGLRIGWVLLHSLWQGVLIGGAFGLARFALRRHSANVRYLAGCVGLLLLVLAPVATQLTGFTPPPRMRLALTPMLPATHIQIATPTRSPELAPPTSLFDRLRSLADFLGRLAPVLAAG